MLKIEFEGTDGAGKTTGMNYFIERAKAQGLSVIETREVGNPHIPVCVKLRQLVLDPSNELDGKSMELIFSAMRLENEQWVKRLLSTGAAPDFLVSDRGWFSHLAYTDHNVSMLFTKQLYYDLVLGYTRRPDRVIYFNVNTETALKRRVSRGGATDVIEMKGVAFQEKVRESFHRHMDRTSIPIFEVDANQSLDNVKLQLDKILLALLVEVNNNKQ